MSAGAIDDTEEPASTLAKLRREHPLFDLHLRRVWQKSPVRAFYIPYGAGVSEDGETPYISYDVNTIVEGVECENCLVRHETTEWALRVFFGIGEDYANDPLGHRIANNAEFDRVRVLLDRPDAVDLYQEIMDSQIHRAEMEDMKGRPIPQDLALYPYEDDPEIYNALEQEMFNARSQEEWAKTRSNTNNKETPTNG